MNFSRLTKTLLAVLALATAFMSDPRFLSLGVQESRLVVPWNAAVTRNPRARQLTRAWLKAAAAAHVTPLVSFTGVAWSVPTVAQYTQAVRAFVKEFPSVRRYTAWNEPDWIYRALGNEPELAAHYYDALSSVCRCLVVAGDVYLPTAQLAPWLHRYIAALHRHPAAWALHNYYDVRHHSTSQLQLLLRSTSGQIWLDETGGVLHRRNWALATPAQAAANERWLFGLAQRYSRISRIYHYQWRAASKSGWDSALLSVSGKLRPAYQVIAKLLGRA
jgi:hypothetical protein